MSTNISANIHHSNPVTQSHGHTSSHPCTQARCTKQHMDTNTQIHHHTHTQHAQLSYISTLTHNHIVSHPMGQMLTHIIPLTQSTDTTTHRTLTQPQLSCQPPDTQHTGPADLESSPAHIQSHKHAHVHPCPCPSKMCVMWDAAGGRGGC